MDGIWDRLEAWLAEHAPRILASLNTPATAESIAVTEATLGVSLPADLQASYHRHDGQAFVPPLGSPGLFKGWRWLPLDRVVWFWNMWRDLRDHGTFDNTPVGTDDRVARVWWHPGWIPFADSGMGYDHSVDLSPGPWGTVGQVITVCHDDERRPVLAPSFRQWLSDYVQDLEDGIFVWCPERQGIYRYDEAM